METKNFKALIYSISIALVLCLPIFGGCQKDKVDENGGVVLLSTLPENSEYSSLPLIGTQWKLLGFANLKYNTVRLAKPLVKGIYVFTFEEDGLISGYTSSNKAGGSFILTHARSMSILFGLETFVNEARDGLRYIEAMNKVSSYRISPKGLSLYYGKDTYLLFQPLDL